MDKQVIKDDGRAPSYEPAEKPPDPGCHVSLLKVYMWKQSEDLIASRRFSLYYLLLFFARSPWQTACPKH
jgi:hypothetical protein